ncbi:hypothetical protein GOP47_0019153 [Adiantum capillus-veneris]|uniref:Nucleolar 27S pre-rRNA processing Urb2/Npa2 C-terminal domain-containing protein n=1 Tax=Adiantum capillus-veneris TaxID=13818 RepID=A0A9D4UEJ3_ADICA|nr:hypothetical protein GOP47_0018881 [Adiantum capillus-veneris]KAI5066529.1 hypothetical protein GOP47_0019153 [Adiantum capillus-veneris]
MVSFIRDVLSTRQTDLGYGTRSFTTAFFLVLLDVVKLLFARHERSFRPKLDLWVSSARSFLKLALTMYTRRNKLDMFGDGSSALLQLILFMCRGFASFLKASPNPRKVFMFVVEKLLESLLSLLAHLRIFENEGIDGFCATEFKSLVFAVKDILKYTLFHPFHLEGYLNVCKLSKQADCSASGAAVEMEDISNSRKATSVSASLLSYHKLLFEQLDLFVHEGKVSTIGSFDWIFRTYIKETKGQAFSRSAILYGVKSKLTSRKSGKKLNGRESQSLGLGMDSNSDKSQEKMNREEGFFAVFVEFLSPLMRRFEKIYPFFSEKPESLFMAKVVLSAVNSLLVVAIEEQVYLATQDTPSLTHFNYMENVANVLIHCSNTLPELFNGAAPTCLWSEESYHFLMAMVKEVLLGFGHILELECRVFENGLQVIWKTLLSATTVQFTAAKKCGKESEVQHDIELSINLASRVIQIFSELRQVDRPIFCLCSFLRHLADLDQRPSLDKLQRKALTSIFLSPRFLMTLAVIMKEVPEGQTASFIRSLKGDLEETLKFVQLARVFSLNECHQSRQAAIKALMEISICVIENANVTASNSIQVEALLKACIDGIVMESLGYLVDSALRGGNVLANFVNLCASGLENPISDLNGSCLAIEASALATEAVQSCQDGVNTSMWTVATVVLFWEFMLRLYISVKLLRRKCISLMPHKQAKKTCLACNDFVMSILMGEVFRAEHFSGREGFFSLARKGAVSILDFLLGIDRWLWETGQKKVDFLLYTLDCVAMLSVSDLKRQIKAISFLLNQRVPTTSENNEGQEGSKTQYVDGPLRREMLSKVDRKILRKHCKKLKLEASSLTNFMTKWISSSKFESKRLDEISHWNKVINSLDKRTLPAARWALLCQNIDVWSEFASENGLIMFSRFMFRKTLLLDAEKKNEARVDCNTFSVTSCLLQDDSFYEQAPIRSLFLHSISEEVLETLSTFKVDSSITSSLSYIESQSGIAAQEPACEHWMRIAKSQDVIGEKRDSDSNSGDTESRKLTKCTYLLNLVIQAPKGFINLSSAASFISFVSKLESSLLVWLLKIRCQWRLDMTKFVSSMDVERLIGVMDLLVASSRSLESLILHEDSSNMDLKGSGIATVLLHNTCSMYWPILSVHAISRCFNDLVPKISDTALRAFSKEKLISYIKCTIGLFTFVSQNLFREHLDSLLMRYKEGKVPAAKGVATLDSLLVLVNTLATQLENCSDLMKLDRSKVLGVLSNISTEGGSSREERSTLQECPFGVLALLGAISTVLWSFTSTLECLDEKCHSDKDGNTKWVGQLPDGLLAWVTVIENFVTDGLHDLLLANENVRKNLSTSESGVDRVVEADKGCTFQDGEDGMGYDSDADMSEDSDIGEQMDFERDVMEADKETEFLKSSASNATEEQRLMSAQASGDFLEMQEPQVLMIREMLSGKLDTHSWMLGELFMAMAAIVKLKSLFHSPNVVDPVAGLSNLQWTTAMQLHVGAASRILQEVVELPQLKGSSCLLLLPGVIKYLESIGSSLPYTRPILSPAAFVDLVNLQLVLHGALLSRIQTVECLNSSTELKFSLQSCFRVFMKKPLGLHFHLALQTIERSLLGLQGRRRRKENEIGAWVGSLKLGSILLGGIECLSLVLDAVSGTKRLQILSRYTARYLAVIFHLIAKSHHWCYGRSHRRVPSATWKHDSCHSAVSSVSLNNLGSTVWKCVEILITFSSREVIFPMNANHLAQAMSCPADLFRHFYQRNIQKEKLMQLIFTASDLSGSKEYEILIPDDRLVVEIYTACCKLLRNLLRHRTRESGHCVALLGESLRALLFFLEVMELSFERKQSFSELDIQSILQCARWLRRVYEEVAEHKTIIGSYITHMLSDYVCIVSGCGMSIKGLSREVEATLRPGAFALVDICSTDDLQQLHAVLGEGPRRSTLTALRREYEQHFKYTGKV